MPPAHFIWPIFLQSYLLQLVLDRWRPHVVSMSCVLYFTLILELDGFSFGAQNVSCGMPVTPTMAPWGTIERSSLQGDSKIKHLVLDVLQKPAFHISLVSVDFGMIFDVFVDSLGFKFHNFWCLGDRLEIWRFSNAVQGGTHG